MEAEMDINDVIDEANEDVTVCSDCGEHLTSVEAYHDSGMCNRCRIEAHAYAADQLNSEWKNERGAA